MIDSSDRLLEITKVALSSAVVKCLFLRLSVVVCLQGSYLKQLALFGLTSLVSLSDHRLRLLIFLFHLLVTATIRYRLVY